MRLYVQLPYRQTEGIMKATGKNLPNHLSYSQICRKVNKLDIPSNRLDDDDDDDDDIIIAINSTGIKVTNRSHQWIQEKWNIKKKKGCLKIHIAVDVNTQEILALEVTDEKVHDGKIMEQLVEQVLENKNKDKDFHIKSVLADGT
jgi:DDE family transposase